MICTLANSMWLAGCLSGSARFHRAARKVEQEQAAILRRLLAANADTEFGRRHGFSAIRSVNEYRERVPIRDYEGHREWIDRIAAGSPNVLTCERVRLFEPTSGSRGRHQVDTLHNVAAAGVPARNPRLDRRSVPPLPGPALRPGLLVRQSDYGAEQHYSRRHSDRL